MILSVIGIWIVIGYIAICLNFLDLSVLYTTHTILFLIIIAPIVVSNTIIETIFGVFKWVTKIAGKK